MGRVDFFAKKDQHSDFEISLQKVTKSVIFKNSAKSPERAVLRLISVNGHRPPACPPGWTGSSRNRLRLKWPAFAAACPVLPLSVPAATT